MAFKLLLLALSEFGLAGFLLPSASLFLLPESDFLQALLFLGLDAGLFLAIEAEAIDPAFADEDLRLSYITS